jgi:hypothetical protein
VIRTKVFATPEEIVYIKQLQNAPVIGITNPEPPGPGVPAVIPAFESPLEACHRYALAHGLPEVSGYYGIDLNTREFLQA